VIDNKLTKMKNENLAYTKHIKYETAPLSREMAPPTNCTSELYGIFLRETDPRYVTYMIRFGYVTRSTYHTFEKKRFR
jgi:hypothetical protein